MVYTEFMTGPDDRRLIRVRPTDHGRHVHAEVLRRWAEVDVRMLSTLPAEQVTVLREALTAMTTNLTPLGEEDIPGPTPRAPCS